MPRRPFEEEAGPTFWPKLDWEAVRSLAAELFGDASAPQRPKLRLLKGNECTEIDEEREP